MYIYFVSIITFGEILYFILMSSNFPGLYTISLSAQHSYIRNMHNLRKKDNRKI